MRCLSSRSELTDGSASVWQSRDFPSIKYSVCVCSDQIQSNIHPRISPARGHQELTSALDSRQNLSHTLPNYSTSALSEISCFHNYRCVISTHYLGYRKRLSDRAEVLSFSVELIASGFSNSMECRKSDMSCISDAIKQSNSLLLSFSFSVSRYQFRKREVVMKTRGHWFSEKDTALTAALSLFHLASK